jgi:hypothetical protein
MIRSPVCAADASVRWRSGWIDFSATEKRTVISALDARRLNFGAAIEARLEDRAER